MATNKLKVYAENPGTNSDSSSTVLDDTTFAAQDETKYGAKKQQQIKSQVTNTVLRETSLVVTALINALESIYSTSATYSPNDTLANFTTKLKTALLGIITSSQNANFDEVDIASANISSADIESADIDTATIDTADITTGDIGTATISLATITTIISNLHKSTGSLKLNLVDGSNNVLGTVSLADNKLRLKYGNGYIDITNSSITFYDGTNSKTLLSMVTDITANNAKVSANNSTITVKIEGKTDQWFKLNQSANQDITIPLFTHHFDWTERQVSDGTITIPNKKCNGAYTYLVHFRYSNIAYGCVAISGNRGSGLCYGTQNIFSSSKVACIRMQLSVSGSDTVLTVNDCGIDGGTTRFYGEMIICKIDEIRG